MVAMCDTLQSVKEQLSDIENEPAMGSTYDDVFQVTQLNLMDMPVEVPFLYLQ